MNLNEFMEKNNIVIVAKANLQEKSFEIIKNDLELESYDLFEQLILFGSIDNLMESIEWKSDYLPVYRRRRLTRVTLRVTMHI